MTVMIGSPEQEHIKEQKREAARQKREAACEANRKMIDQGKSLLRPEQAAAYLSVELQTLANWRVGGRGPEFVRIGRLIRYRLASLDTWITANSSK